MRLARLWLAGGVAIVIGAATAPTADAATWKRCSPSPRFPVATLSVRAMTCPDGLATVQRLRNDNPGVNRIPFGATRRFRTTGRTRGKVRRLTCSVRYGAGTGANRGGIQMTVRCRDDRNDGLNYTEQQDNE